MGGHVLLVENNPDLQRRVGDALRAMGFSVTTEAELSWALRRIDARAPDAVVADTWLPDGTGFQLGKELRRTRDTRDVPIVFLASREHRGAAHRAEALRRFSPADYFQAPLQAPLVAARLMELIPDTAMSSSSHQSRDDDETTGTVLAPNPFFGEVTGVTSVDPVDPVQQYEQRQVEKDAKVLSQTDPEWKGSLKRTSFAMLLRRLFARKATGSLLLLHDSRKKIVTFDEGYPVSVKSNVLAECLGQILLAQRLISPEALQESVRRLRVERRYQGEILVEMGVLSPHNLARALLDQLEAKVLEIFSWDDGQFLFKDGTPATGSGSRLDRSPAALVREGVRRFYDEGRKARVLTPFEGSYVALTADPVLRFQEITRDEEELAFLAELDGRTKWETVVSTSRLDNERTRSLLVALVETGMIERSETAVRRAPVLSSPAAEPRERLRTSPSGLPLMGAQLELVAETVRQQNHFWALGVDVEANSATVERAYADLAGSFHPDRYRGASARDRELAAEVFGRLGEAYRVLRDSNQRRLYASRLDKQDKSERGGQHAPSPPTPAPTLAAEQLYDVGVGHLRARRYHQAVEFLRQAARALPNRADFRAALGWSLFHEAPADARAGRAALAELRRAVQLDPRSANARRYLGLFYAQTGQTDLALGELEALLDLDPTAHDVVEELTRLRAAGGSWREE